MMFLLNNCFKLSLSLKVRLKLGFSPVQQFHFDESSSKTYARASLRRPAMKTVVEQLFCWSYSP